MANKKNKLQTLDLEKIKEELGEEPLDVSGLKYSEEKYKEKVEKLSKLLESDELGAREEKYASKAIRFYKMALSLEIPASGLTILGGKPYINTAGLLYKTHRVAQEKGGVRKITVKPLESAESVKESAIFIGRVEFGDGAIFEDIGEASAANIKMSTIKPFLNSMAARRATNRAMRLATSVGLVSAEEIGTEDNKDKDSGDITLLSKDEYEKIKDILDKFDDVENEKDLEKIKKEFDKRKDDMSNIQINNIMTAYKEKKKDLGILV